MPAVSASIDIDAPPERIWELMCDPNRYPELADPTERMLHVPDEPMGVGYVYREHGGVGPFKDDSEWTVTEFEPTRRQVHEGDDGTMKYHLEIVVDSVDKGTRLTQNLAISAGGAMRIASAIIWPLFMRRLAQRAMENTVANVKQAAESKN